MTSNIPRPASGFSMNSRIPIHTSTQRRPSPSPLHATSKFIDRADASGTSVKLTSRIPVRGTHGSTTASSKEPLHIQRKTTGQVVKTEQASTHVALNTQPDICDHHPTMAVRPLNVKSKGLAPRDMRCSTHSDTSSVNVMPKITSSHEVGQRIAIPTKQANTNGEGAEKRCLRRPGGRRRSSAMLHAKKAARTQATNLRKVSKKTRKEVQWGRARTSASPKKFVPAVKPILK